MATDHDPAMDRLLSSMLSSAQPGDACPDAETLAAWVEHTLRPAEMAYVETHASSCARCQTIAATMLTTFTAASAAGEKHAASVVTGIWTRWRLNWLMPVAAAAMAIAIYVATRPSGPVLESVQSDARALGEPSSALERSRAAEIPSLSSPNEPVGAAGQSTSDAPTAPFSQSAAAPGTPASTTSAGRADAPAQPSANPAQQSASTAQQSANTAQQSANAARQPAAIASAPAPAAAPFAKSTEPPANPASPRGVGNGVALARPAPQGTTRAADDAAAREERRIADGAPSAATSPAAPVPAPPTATFAPVPASPPQPGATSTPAASAPRVAESSPVPAPPTSVAPSPAVPPRAPVSTVVAAPPPAPRAPERATAAGTGTTRDAPNGVAGGVVGGTPLGGASIGAVRTLAAAPIEVRAASGNDRWRVSAAGQVERSTNGGTTWRTGQSLSAGIRAGASPAAGVCWFVGRGGAIWLSTDGATFRRLTFPEAADLVAVTATSARAASVTTADRRVFRTDDGGVTWRVVP